MEELCVPLEWRDNNLLWNQVCAAVSVIYLENDGEVEEPDMEVDA